MMKVLKELKVDWKDRRMIKDLYMRQEAVVRLECGNTEKGEIGQGCGKDARYLLCFQYMQKVYDERCNRLHR